MIISQERNSYLKRSHCNTPHKSGFEQETGNHYLLSEDGSHTPISRIGTFKPKFRNNFTGFASAKERQLESKNDPSVLFFTPSNSFHKQNSFYTPKPRKFVGYAQQPFQLRKNNKSEFLDEGGDHTKLKRKKKKEKMNENKGRLTCKINDENTLLRHFAKTFMSKNVSQDFFETALENQRNSRPLTRYSKKSCYNSRCKLKNNATLNEREKMKTGFWNQMFKERMNNEECMRVKSFHDKFLEEERRQKQTLKSTFI